MAGTQVLEVHADEGPMLCTFLKIHVESETLQANLCTELDIRSFGVHAVGCRKGVAVRYWGEALLDWHSLRGLA